MSYVHVTIVGSREVKRTHSTRAAAEAMVSECKKLIDLGTSPSVRGSCWIETYLVDAASVEAALSPRYNIGQHRWVGIDFFNDVITDAHNKGWMRGGEWLAQAA